MATMMGSGSSIRELERIIREDMRRELSMGEPGKPGGPAYVLRRDGDTDKYRIVGRQVVKTRIPGHVTLGLWVDRNEVPCIIY